MSQENSYKPTEAEARNGWTEESLTKYINESNAEEALRAGLSEDKQRLYVNRQETTVSDYDPTRW